jgi:hypothetical protein
MKLEGANARSYVSGLAELPGKVNYFIGNNSAKWHKNIPTYAKVQYSEVYPGINLIYYGNQRQLEYDLIVSPGADPNRIKLAFEGAEKVNLDPSGDLILKTVGGELQLKKPLVYQEVNGTREPVAARYVLMHQAEVAGGEVGIKVADYDPRKPLIIDPVLSYSTYLGGSGGDHGYGIAVDASGNAYVTGTTSSTDFPTAGSLQVYGGSGDVFVTKFNPSGSALIYSTYLGGSDGDEGNGIAVDGTGNAYVVGDSISTDFPTVSPLKNSCGSCDNDDPDAIVAKLNATGSALIYSTYLGGSQIDYGYGIAVDGSGNAFVTGTTFSTDFPTAAPLQVTCGGCVSGQNAGNDAFVTKLNPSGSAPTYSTFLGGSDGDEGRGIAVDGSGSVYLTGTTNSSDFPTVNPLQSTCGGGNCSYLELFVTKLNAAGSAMVYSTYLGGSNHDYGFGIAVDGSGNAFVTGVTYSTDFPKASPFQSSCLGCSYGDAIVAKLNAAGSALVYSTYLGGSGPDYGYAIAVDGSGNASVTGSTGSVCIDIGTYCFPTTANAIQPDLAGGPFDAFVTKLNSAGSVLVHSTYLGGTGGEIGWGIAVDGSGNTYVTGDTYSTDFPTVNPFQASHGGGIYDAFVVKIGPSPDLIVSSLQTSTTAIAPGKNISLFNAVKNQGDASAGSSVAAFHLSTNTTYGDGDDIPFTFSRSVGPLAAGAKSTATNTLTIPAPTPLGNYYICAMADSGNVVAEDNETNNSLCTAAMIQVTLADLVTTDVTPNSGTVNQGGTLSVSDTVQNVGAVATPIGFRVGFHLSVNNVYGDGDDVAITTNRVVAALGAGASSTGTTGLLIPSSTPPGDYYVCAKADSLAQVVETDETNNTLCSSTQVTVPQPDLIVSGLSTTIATVKAGGVAYVTNAIKNQGGSKAGTFVVAFHLSTNAVYGDGDDIVSITTRTIGSLGIGATSSATNAVRIPAGTSAGDYYICANADDGNTVTESDEGNNSRCTTTTITVTVTP